MSALPTSLTRITSSVLYVCVHQAIIILLLKFEGLFVELNGVFGFLNVHESLCDHLIVGDSGVCVKYLEVAAGVVVAVLQLVQVDLRLLLLRLQEAAVVRLDLLQHVQCLLRVAHLHRQVSLRQHHTHLLWCVRKLSHRTRQNTLCRIEILQFTLHIYQVQEYPGSLFLAEWKRLFLTEGQGRVFDTWKIVCVLESLEGIRPVLRLDLHLRLHQHEHGILPDLEIVSESLLQILLSRLHIAALTVD